MGKAKDLREAVEAELSSDHLVDAADIAVRNVKGNVALMGTLPSYPQYLETAEAACRIPGVTKVRNQLEVVLSPEDYRDDAKLTTAANNALAASGTAALDRVEATAKDGNLALTGMVRYRRHRAAAEAAVSGLTGVRNIKDHIQFLFDVDPADVNQLVGKALDRQRVPPGDRHVTASTDGNMVVLAGKVQTQAQHDAVVGATWLGHGVVAVVDEIEVTSLRSARQAVRARQTAVSQGERRGD